MHNTLENIDDLPDRASGNLVTGNFYKDAKFPRIAYRFVGDENKIQWEPYYVLKQRIPDDVSFVGEDGVHRLADAVAQKLAGLMGNSDALGCAFEAYQLLTVVYQQLMMRAATDEDRVEYLRRVIYGDRS